MADRIPLDIAPGVWVEIDEPCVWCWGRSSCFEGSDALGDGSDQIRWVHVMSTHAGGEITGYALWRGELRRMLPRHPAWPEMDASVTRATGWPVHGAAQAAAPAGSQLALFNEASHI